MEWAPSGQRGPTQGARERDEKVEVAGRWGGAGIHQAPRLRLKLPLLTHVFFVIEAPMVLWA